MDSQSRARAPYRAILFDLFGTLVFLDPSRRVDPRRFLREAVERELPQIEFVAFLEALGAVSLEMERERRMSHREFSSPERFRRALMVVGDPGSVSRAERLCRAHMRGLSSCAEMPAAHLELVRALASRLPLGLVSNFDYAPTARCVLDRCELSPYLNPIVISEEHGFRKPHQSIFARAVEELSLEPEEILFVGDTPLDDVHGARSAGLDAVWVNWKADPYPEDLEPPTFVVAELVEVAAVLAS